MKRAALALLLCGCTNILSWTTDAPTPRAPDPSDTSTLVHLWAITQGECTPAPGIPMETGEVHVDPPLGALPLGPYCFWSMQVYRYTRSTAPTDRAGEPCELVSIGSVSRTLPAEQGSIVTTETEVAPTDGTWDHVVELVAECAPRRFTERCECPFSVPADDGGDRLRCLPPVEGDLIAIGDDHSCVGRLGASTITCWGDQRGFSSETGVVGPTEVPAFTVLDSGEVEPIVELDVGPGLTCARTEAGNVHCIGAATETFAGLAWHPLRDPSTASAPVHFDEVGVGENLVCGLGSRPTNFGSADPTTRQEAGVYCFGLGPGAAAWSYTGTATSERTVLSGIAVGRRHLCAIASDPVSIPSAGAGAIVRESVVHCAGDANEWRELARVGGETNSRRIEAGGDRTCSISSDRRLRCWTAGATTAGPERAVDVLGARLSSTRLCARRSAGLVCGDWSVCDAQGLDTCARPLADEVPPLAGTAIGLVQVGSTELCGVATADGSVLCASDVGSPDTVAHRASAAASRVVCPYPFPL